MAKMGLFFPRKLKKAKKSAYISYSNYGLDTLYITNYNINQDSVVSYVNTKHYFTYNIVFNFINF